MKLVAIHCSLVQGTPGRFAPGVRWVSVRVRGGGYGDHLLATVAHSRDCRLYCRPGNSRAVDGVLRVRRLGEEDGDVQILLPDRTTAFVGAGQVCETPWDELLPVPWG